MTTTMIIYAAAFLATAFVAIIVYVRRVPPRRRRRPDPPLPLPGVRRAFLFGLNYVERPDTDTEGCWKDLADLVDVLVKSGRFADGDVLRYPDARVNGKHFTSYAGMKRLLERLRTRGGAEFVYVHFVGLGTGRGLVTSGRDDPELPCEWLDRWALSLGAGTRVTLVLDCDVSEFAWTSSRVNCISSKTPGFTRGLVDALRERPGLLDDVHALATVIPDPWTTIHRPDFVPPRKV